MRALLPGPELSSEATKLLAELSRQRSVLKAVESASTVTVVADARVNCQRSAGIPLRQCPGEAEVESFPATVCPSCIVPPPTVVRTMVPLDALQLFPSLDSAMRFVSSAQARRK